MAISFNVPGPEVTASHYVAAFDVSKATCLLRTETSPSNPHLDVSYGKKNIDAYVKYSESNHGSDGALFLDPFFKPAIETLEGRFVLDIGCGAAPWSIYAAKQGGRVWSIDIQPEMIEAAKQKVKTAQVEEKVSLSVGDASNLAYPRDFFDREISICVGCNLPLGIYEKSFQEIARTLKTNGIAVIGTPNSLDVVFTNGSKTAAEVQKHIASVLGNLPEDPSQEMISNSLSQLTEVLSATFYIKNQRLTLVTNEHELTEGEKIWRKLPVPIVPNRYHSQLSYINAFKESKLKILSVTEPHFSNEAERANYNAQASTEGKLGAEYVTHAPFAIYYVTKE